LSEWTGGCWPVCGLVFPGLLFLVVGVFGPVVGVGAPTTFFVALKIGLCRGCVRFSNTPPTFMFPTRRP